VTAYTSFIAVDSNAVSTTSTDPDGDDDDDGGIVEVDNLSFSSSSEREFIKVFGTVTQLGEMLKLKLENIAAISTSPLTLQITNLNGQVLTTYQVKPADLENLINIPLNGVPAGLYVVSLVSKSQVIDAEKFVVR
jgi:hypothetical protein